MGGRPSGQTLTAAGQGSRTVKDCTDCPTPVGGVCPSNLPQKMSTRFLFIYLFFRHETFSGSTSPGRTTKFGPGTKLFKTRHVKNLKDCVKTKEGETGRETRETEQRRSFRIVSEGFSFSWWQ